MHELSTMIDLLEERVSTHGERVAFIFLDDQGEQTSLTYGELQQRARSIGAALQERVQVGERVLLVYPAGLEFIAAFFGCLYAGVVAVPATYPKPRRPLPRMNRIALDSGAKWTLTTAQTLSTLDRGQVEAEVGEISWLASDEIAVDEGIRWNMPGVGAEDLAFLQYTSGSTSDPKGVMVTHGNLLANLQVIRGAFRIGNAGPGEPDSTGVFWLPAYHDMGLIGGILTPLYVGGKSVLMSPPSFLQRPIRWLQAIGDFEATISGAPNFAYQLCVDKVREAEIAALDLSTWRLAFCGAEPVRSETMQGFASRFAAAGFDRSSLYPCYGLAESTLLAAGSDHAQPPTIESFDRAALAEHRAVGVTRGVSTDQSHELVGSGRPMPGHKLLIVSNDDELSAAGEAMRVLPENQVGEIVLQGPSVAKGYWRREEATAECFHTDVEGHEGHFLRTGDLGFLRAGELFVTGRLKDVIIVRGRNHYPQDIEQTVEQAHEALMPGAAFSVTVEGREELVVVHQIDRQYRNQSCDNVLRAMRRAVKANHDLDPHAIVLIRQTSLPLTSSGKVQRRLCREQYLREELKVVDCWIRPADARLSRPVESGEGATASQSVRLDEGGVVVSRSASEHPSQARQSMSGMNVDRAAERIEAWMMAWLIERAGLDEAELDRNRPFAELGVDSMTAVELSQELEDEFGVALNPVVAWNYPTPETLAKYLANEAIGRQQAASRPSPAVVGETAGSVAVAPLSAVQPPATIPAAPESSDPIINGAEGLDLEALLAEVEGLSDEEAAALLSRDAS